MSTSFRFARLFCLTAALIASGCKRTVTDDATVTAAVQTKLASDAAIAAEPIQSSVQSGIATLSGGVSSEAARALAARDAAQVAGVRTVVNNLTVGSQSALTQAPAPMNAAPAPVNAAPAPVAPVISPRERIRTERIKPSARVDRDRVDGNQQPPAPIVERPAPVPGPSVAQTVAPPPPPPQPSFRDISVPARTTIPVRITQTLDSGSTQQGQTFSGTLSSDVMVDGLVAIPQGSAVSGRVDAVQEAAHFKGNSLLTVSLTSISRGGERMPVSTEAYSKEGNGRGKNTVEKTGIGAAAGAILGGIFGGGSGAAIGAAAGGGAGAGINGVTRGQEVQIASESLISFRLTSPVTVRVRLGDKPRTPDAGEQADPSRRPLP